MRRLNQALAVNNGQYYPTFELRFLDDFEDLENVSEMVAEASKDKQSESATGENNTCTCMCMSSEKSAASENNMCMCMYMCSEKCSAVRSLQSSFYTERINYRKLPSL